MRDTLLAALAAGSVAVGGAWMSAHSTKAPKRRLVVAIPARWGKLLPPLQNSAYSAVVLENEFEPLVRRGLNGLIEPLAAKSWQVRGDHRVIRFILDTNRRFSDGSPLTAQDVKRSWEDGLRLKAESKNKSVEDALYSLRGYSAFDKKGTIEGVRVVSSDTLELEFTEPARVPLGYLSGARYGVYKFVRGRAVGTGPYVIEESSDTLSLRPNSYYVGDEKRFDEVRIIVTPVNELRQKIAEGAVDAALFVEKANLSDCAEGAKGPIKCVFSQEADHVAVEINGLAGRLLADASHRQALQALILDALDKDGSLPNSFRARSFSRDPQSFLPYQPGRLSPQEAASLIDAGRAGIPALMKASKKRPLLVVCGLDCAWLIDLLRQAGVAVDERSGKREFKQVLEMIYTTHEADLIVGTFSVYNGDPDGLYHLLGRHGAIFSTMMDRPGIADLLEAGRRVTDRNALPDHYEKVARAILTEVPYVHLGYNCRGVAFNSEKVRVAPSFLERNNQRVTLFEPR